MVSLDDDSISGMWKAYFGSSIRFHVYVNTSCRKDELLLHLFRLLDKIADSAFLEGMGEGPPILSSRLPRMKRPGAPDYSPGMLRGAGVSATIPGTSGVSSG